MSDSGICALPGTVAYERDELRAEVSRLAGELERARGERADAYRLVEVWRNKYHDDEGVVEQRMSHLGSVLAWAVHTTWAIKGLASGWLKESDLLREEEALMSRASLAEERAVKAESALGVARMIEANNLADLMNKLTKQDAEWAEKYQRLMVEREAMRECVRNLRGFCDMHKECCSCPSCDALAALDALAAKTGESK